LDDEKATVQQAVLLRESFIESARDGHSSRLDRLESGADRPHEPLSVKALTNAP
jgi:hypothetical protein